MLKILSISIIIIVVMLFLNCSNGNKNTDKIDDDDSGYDVYGKYLSKSYCGESDYIYSCQEIGRIESEGEIYSMIGRSKEEVYFGGRFNYQMLKYDGNEFMYVDIPLEEIYHFWGNLESGLLASDGKAIMKQVGNEWNIITEGPTEENISFWSHCGDSSVSIYAFGQRQNDSSNIEPVIMHFDGITWNYVSLPELDYYWELWNGWCTSNNELFINIFSPNSLLDIPGKYNIYNYRNGQWNATIGMDSAEQLVQDNHQNIYAVNIV